MTETPAVTIVIDNLPPIVGGNLMSIGPQVLSPDHNGVITSLVGVDQRITLSSVGGPTDISLTAEKTGNKLTSAEDFNLTESADTLLWSGIVSLTKPGEYDLMSHAVDGAGITTTQSISTLNVVADPYTYSQKNSKRIQSTVTLYYLDPDTNSWVVWDGSGYSESNPQVTDSHGNFKLFIPSGTYYLKASSPGYQTLVSSIFKANQSEPVTTNLGLKPLRQLSLGPLHLSLPTLSIKTINLTPSYSVPLSQAQNNLIGKPLSDFSLTDTNGTTVHAANLLGRPTLITLGSTWSPTTSEQLQALSKLQSNQNLNIIPIAMQQSTGQVTAYTSIAGLNLNWLVDPDSTLSPYYGSPDLPTQYFVDRNGIIRQIYVGVLSQSQIENRLSSL
jgi:peroxiredoxin